MPTSDQLRLDDQLCFALYAASNAIVRSYRPRLAALGITYPQYLLLMLLWEHDDQPTSALADRLQLPVHGVLPILERLQLAGFVRRVRDQADRRVVRVSLTTDGAALEARAAAVQHAVVCDTGLDPEHLAALRDGLHDLTADLAAEWTAAEEQT